MGSILWADDEKHDGSQIFWKGSYKRERLMIILHAWKQNSFFSWIP